MLIAVFSDSHGDTEPMRAALRTKRPELCLHLGDHDSDLDTVRAEFPEIAFRAVRGNCDFGSVSELYETFTAEGVSFFMTHGHGYNVKYTLDSLANAAHFTGSMLALYGHTHISDYRKMGGVTLFNPGAVKSGSYGLITVSEGSFSCRIETL